MTTETNVLSFPAQNISYVRGPSITLNFPPGFDAPEATFELNGVEYPAGSTFRVRGQMTLEAGSLSASCGGSVVSLGAGPSFDQNVTTETATDIFTLVGDEIDGKVTLLQVDVIA